MQQHIATNQIDLHVDANAAWDLDFWGRFRRGIEAADANLERVLADPAWAKEMGEKARRQVAENYSVERLGREINGIYEELVEEKFGASA